MPAFIRTQKDEARWKKAKQAANESHSESEGDSYWAVVNHIYQNMSKADFMENLLEKLNKAGGDEDEEENDVQNYEQTPEDLEAMGLHEFDPFEEGSDEADAWLRENDPRRQEEQESAPDEETEPGQQEAEVESGQEVTPEVKPKSKSGYADWAPRQDYSDDEQKAIKGFMDQGYSHREAERMAGAHKGPKNFQEALTHNIRPSQMSEKMLGELRDIAGHWLERADRQSKLTADPEKNPMKYASGKMLQAHEDATKDYNKAYSDFLASDELKDKKGLDRHKAIQAWKQKWKGENPDYHAKLGSISEAQKHMKEAKEMYGKNIHDKLMHIVTGGMADPSNQMSAEEAAQHVGATKEEEGGHQASIIKDPSASFAAANQPFMEHARGQSTYTRGPKTRLQTVQEQMAEKPKAPTVNTDAARKVIIRRANPEQMQRFHRTTSARNTLGVNKPEGDK